MVSTRNPDGLTEILQEDPGPIPIPPILEAIGAGVLVADDMGEVMLMSMMAQRLINALGKAQEDVKQEEAAQSSTSAFKGALEDSRRGHERSSKLLSECPSDQY